DEGTSSTNSYIEQQTKGAGATSDHSSEIENLKSQISSLSNSEETLKTQIEENEQAMTSYDEEAQNNIDTFNDYCDTVEEGSGTIDESFLTISEAYEGLSDAQTAAIDSILSAYETLTGSLSDLTTKIVQDDETTWAQIQANQTDTIAKTREFSDLYAQLIEAGVSESYLEAIGATGPEATPLLQDMLDSGTDTVLASQTEWEDAYGMIGDTLIDSFDLDTDTKEALKEYITGETGIVGTLKTAVDGANFDEVGLALSDGLTEGIESGSEDTETSMVDIMDGVRDAAKEAAGIHSPSTVFAEIGEYLDAGLAMGILNGGQDAFDAIKTITDAMKKVAEQNLASIEVGFESSFAGASESVDGRLQQMVNTVKNGTNAMQKVASA
ncbi:MAG: phage tail protein, partial [Sporomusa sp.]